jgi:riboflavin-specific deaminase-like protein
MQRLYPSPAYLADGAALEQEYLIPFGPHLRANFVTSLDGVVEVGGHSAPLGSVADRAAFLAMRAVADAVLVGAGTVRAENYGPVRVDAAACDRRVHRGQDPLPTLAIVSNQADLDPSHRVFGGDAKPLLLTSAEAARARTDLARVAEIVVCGAKRVEVTVALDQLRNRGLSRILCEGGPSLFRSLVEAQLVDELCCTTSPGLIGPGHHTLLGHRPLSDPVSLQLIAVLEGDGMLITRYAGRVQP